MSLQHHASRISIIAVIAIGVAGCRTDGMPSLPGSSGTPVAVEAMPKPPPVNMAGRWMLAQPGRGQCNMTFRAAAATEAEGTIAPEGGCPGNFYTSRNWNFEQAGLILRDHTGAPLGQLSPAGHARFDGRSVAGEPITLYR